MFERPLCPQCGGELSTENGGDSCPRCKSTISAAPTVDYLPRPAKTGSGPNIVELEAFRQGLFGLGLATPFDVDGLPLETRQDPIELARALMRLGKLTRYQAGALLQGKAKGLKIGPFWILDRLGEGGMGVVFKARHQTSGSIVALKVLPPAFARDKSAVSRFRREFRIASKLRHPNLVSAIEADEDRGVPYLTMEYVEGRDLDALVREGGPLNLKMGLHCLTQMARGLEAAHAQGIVHRDVKPGNVMIDSNGNVRVLDLGLARIIEVVGDLAQDATKSLTQTGAYMGTADYLAPEQADDAKRADHRADIYSLGCSIYFLLTGTVPFPAETILKRLMAHQEKPAPSLRAARADVPLALDALCGRMMAKRSEDRPQSMTEVVAALEALRTSPREEEDATTDLRAFARTFMKRAVTRRLPADPSIFASFANRDKLRINPSLAFEDVVTDYRDEVAEQPLTEDKLPPIVPREPAPRRRLRRRPQAIVLLSAGLILVVGFSLLMSRPNSTDPTPHEQADENPAPIPPRASAKPAVDVVAAAEDAPIVKEEGYVPLFNGKDLTGWSAVVGGASEWQVEDGAIVLPDKGTRKEAIFLLTRRAYGDFWFRFEFQTIGNANGGFMAVERKPNASYGGWVEVVDLQAAGTTNCWIWGDGGPMRSVTLEHVPYKSGNAWQKIEMKRAAGLISVWVNGTRVHNDFNGLKGPQSLGFQGIRGGLRVRNLEIKPVRPGAESDESTPKAPSLLGRVILSDDFSNPASGFRNEEQKIKGGTRPIRRKYENGIYLLEVPEKWAGFEAWDCTGPLDEDFQIEATGRVLGAGNINGGWGFMLPGPEGRGVEVSISRDAFVAVNPCQWGTDKYPNDVPYLQPTPHPNVKIGNEWNKLTVRVRKRSVEVLVNDVAVCNTIVLPWDYRPIKPEIAVFKPTSAGRIRAEFDNLEIRGLNPAK